MNYNNRNVFNSTDYVGDLASPNELTLETVYKRNALYMLH